MSSLVLRPLDPLRLRPVPGFSGMGDLFSGIPKPPPRGDPEVSRGVARLILEGVLEIEGPDGFVSGPRAHREVVEEAPGQNPKGHAARLSFQALHFSQALATRDRRVISRRLYLFNSIPNSPRCLRRHGWDSQIMRLLDPDSASLLPEKGWVRDREEVGRSGWVVWHATDSVPSPLPDNPVFKLYISPRPKDLPEAVEKCLPVLAEAGALTLKVPFRPSEILRPDKMVAHFYRLEDVAKAAAELASLLSGMEAQGVPFSVSLDQPGLLSWGMDPLRPGGRVAPRKRLSWRTWLTRTLGHAMSRVPVDEPGPEPWEFALACLSLQGIDDETFAPGRAWQTQHLA